MLVGSLSHPFLSEELQLVSTITRSSKAGREKEYFITFMRHEKQPFKGILIK